MAFDPDTGERHDDVIVIWVASDHDKVALVQDPDSPFFTTDHFDGHPSVLVRASRLHEVGRHEVIELVQDAWLSRISHRRANQPRLQPQLPQSGPATSPRGASSTASSSLSLTA